MNHPDQPTAAVLHANEADLFVRAMLLARTYVTEVIETEAVRVHLPEPGRWYDTRPMLDQNEHAPQIIDLSRQVLDYGLLAGTLHRHSQQQHLVRINCAAAG